MSTPRPLHIFGMVRFYQDLREQSGESWHEDQSTLADAVLQRIDVGEDSVGYHVVVIPSPAMHCDRWTTMFNTATQCFVMRELVHENGGVYTPEETAAMAGVARDLGMAKLLERIRENHPEAKEAETLPEHFDFYAIGHAID